MERLEVPAEALILATLIDMVKDPGLARAIKLGVADLLRSLREDRLFCENNSRGIIPGE